MSFIRTEQMSISATSTALYIAHIAPYASKAKGTAPYIAPLMSNASNVKSSARSTKSSARSTKSSALYIARIAD